MGSNNKPSSPSAKIISKLNFDLKKYLKLKIHRFTNICATRYNYLTSNLRQMFKYQKCIFPPFSACKGGSDNIAETLTTHFSLNGLDISQIAKIDFHPVS